MDHKEMAAIAADWLAGRQPEDDDVPMENMVVDDPVPTPSSAPSSPVHCTMTIGEARAQYMDTVRQKREEQFREAQADAAYNHHLLQEHLQAEEQIGNLMKEVNDELNFQITGERPQSACTGNCGSCGGCH